MPRWPGSRRSPSWRLTLRSTPAGGPATGCSGASTGQRSRRDRDSRWEARARVSSDEAMGQLTKTYRWAIGGVIVAALVGCCVWLVYTDAPAYRFLVRLYFDKKFLKQTLRQLGILAPILFMVLQGLQVVISPIPGEATGFLGGYLF